MVDGKFPKCVCVCVSQWGNARLRESECANGNDCVWLKVVCVRVGACK